MRLLMIRHGDPDYVHDCLTERGRREAEVLAEHFAKFDPQIDAIYVSPLGRAQETASYTLRRLGKEAQTLGWLREFSAQLDANGSKLLPRLYPDVKQNEDGTYKPRIVWDMTPGVWAALPDYEDYLDPRAWRRTEVARRSDMAERCDEVCGGLDALLARHGYERRGHIYATSRGNDLTLALFCHFGVTAVMLSHLWNQSPFSLLQYMAAVPTAVTELFTEERSKGAVIWRMRRFGDFSHLTQAGIEPSFSARFASVYEHEDERH